VITTLAFYVFATIMVASAAMVVTARNPVHSVLWLILAFFNAAGLFVLLGAEFLAMILMIVYVGAVAVLFLFVVMMLDINFEELRKGFIKYLPIGLAVGGVLLVELIIVGGGFVIEPDAVMRGRAAVPVDAGMTNTRALGQIVYTNYVYLFQGAGLILLVAMIGAIVLTHRQRAGVKRQNIGQQVARTPQAAIANVKSVSGEGVDV
jgi:NADH-quinone oxidoreductase subunit J